MAELLVQPTPDGNAGRVTNVGPDTVILTAISDHRGEGRFFAGSPLEGELELITGAYHQFIVAPSLADGSPLKIDISFTDDSGGRTKTYDLHI